MKKFKINDLCVCSVKQETRKKLNKNQAKIKQ